MATRQASEIRYGVEIECYLPTGVQCEVGGYHNGLQINWAPAGWNGQADGSIHAPAGYKEVEIVSPPMKGEDGLIEIYYMVETIKELGGQVNGSCGLHVHVDANTLTSEQVRELRQQYLRVEKTIYSLSGEGAGRRYNHNHYCTPSRMCSDITNRYQGLNLTNYFSPSPLRSRTDRRTIEIRAWAGTLEPETIITAVYMAVGLVAAVEAGERMATDSPQTFATMWTNEAYRVVPQETAEQLVEVLNTKVAQADRLAAF